MDDAVKRSDFISLEGKVDALIGKVNAILVLEERQRTQDRAHELLVSRVEKLEDRLDKAVAKADERMTREEKRLDRYLNLGLGGWSMVLICFEVYRTVFSK